VSKTFESLKECLSSPPILIRPKPNEFFYLYLSIVDEAVSSVLISENEKGQCPIFFAGKSLSGLELRYQKIEKVAYALIISARRLIAYFLAYTIVARTEAPLNRSYTDLTMLAK